MSLLAALPPLLLGLAVHRQGFNLLDDGLWVLGGKLLAEGGVLYRDLFTIYGPARYVLLLPCLLAAGKSALALALLEALLDGIAGLLGFRLARRLGARGGAWLVPLGVIALGPVQPRYVAAVALAWLAGAVWANRPGLRGGFGLGCAWGGLCAFGLDAAAAGAVILGAGAVLAGPLRPGRAAWLGTAAGAGAVLLCLLAAAAAGGALGAALWDTVVYPATRFAGEMGISWLDSFSDGAGLGRPFADLMTGEEPGAAWPGHAALRTLALRTLYLLVWLPALLGLGRALRARRAGEADAALIATVTACALAGWATLLGRGDEAHLRSAWFASLVLLPALLARLPGPRGLRAAAPVLFGLLALAPLAGEKLWLAARAGRPALCAWDRPGARIAVACSRRDALEALFRGLPRRPGDPLLVWPAQPGLHVLFDAPPACPQVTLLAGEVRDAAAVAAALDASRPPVALVGRTGGLLAGVRSVRQLAPDLWAYLRRRYRVADTVTTPGDEYWVLARLPEGRDAPGRVPLDQQLADAEQRVANAASPALQPGVSLGQTFRVGPLDLQGVALRLAVARPPAAFPVRLTLWSVRGGVPVEPVGRWERQVSLAGASERVTLDLGPLPGTARRELALTLEVPVEVPGGVFLGWHAPRAGERFEDFYTEGTALVDGRPVAADLYFLTY